MPLRTLLTLPNLMQIGLLMTLLGGLSWWYWQQTSQRFAAQIQREIGEQVQLKLETYLATPRLITQLNQSAVELGQIDLNDPTTLQQHLFRQLQQFEQVSGILIGTEQGMLRAINRRGGLHLLRRDPVQPQLVHEYQLSAAGQVKRQLNTFVRPALPQMPWYRAAAQTRQTVWSEIFQTPDNRDLSLNANTPLVDPQTGKLLGVASAGVVLSVIDRFLDQIEVSDSGLVFVMDRQGQLIGTSVKTPSYQSQQQDGQVKLVQTSAIASDNALIRATARSLRDRFTQFDRIVEPQQLVISQQGQQSYVRAVPYRDAFGLDWLIVVVVPQTDLMAQLRPLQRNLVLLCLIAAAIALILGAVVANWIAKSMRQFSQTSQSIAAGDRNQRVTEQLPIQELQIAAQSFNQMAAQLERSFQQIEATNAVLEQQIQERTGQLQQALAFEDLLRRIIEKVRDSLDEAQILQTVVRELAIGLAVQGCNVALYDWEQQTATIRYEHLCRLPGLPPGETFAFADFPELYRQLQQPVLFQFCWMQPLPGSVRNVNADSTCLVCSICDDQGILGDLWLFKPKQDCFHAAEMQLVQQVANQCAIALRQSRLYQTAQSQVQELERLHRLKDDFLSTVSHELRTPMSNIKMATQLLEIQFDRLAHELPASAYLNAAQRYLQILHAEGQREILLINNLLDLSRLESGAEPGPTTVIDLNCWLPQVAQPFVERTAAQGQHFSLELTPNLPQLTTDAESLERILTELLHNACKYTPPDERIALGALLAQDRPVPVGAQLPDRSADRLTDRSPDHPLHRLPDPQTVLRLSVTNSGTEIPPAEIDRIFEKFYRIPSHDPWKHGGTGLGLALVKKLVERLGGTIEVKSDRGQTMFLVDLPLSQAELNSG